MSADAAPLLTRPATPPAADETGQAAPEPRQASRRDPRVDVLRGLALLMIFIDHIPDNVPARFTLHNFGFSDAAELFVLLAGYSAQAAYGGLIERAGLIATLRRIGMRCLRIYLVQAGLVLVSVLVVRTWMDLTGLTPRVGVAPLLHMGLARGLLAALALNALPNYLDILPLYIILLALFPVIRAGQRRFGLWPVLAASATVWLAANLDHRLNLPNAAADDGWYFNPFTWQLLFVVGVALATVVGEAGSLRPRRWLQALCWAYCAFALVQAAPWATWGLPNLHPFALAPPDKSHVVPFRLVHILAVIYLLFSSGAVRCVAELAGLRWVSACGRHSLEVFALGCLAALFGRILYRTFGPSWPLQVGVNVVGLSAMIGFALVLDGRARRRRRHG